MKNFRFVFLFIIIFFTTTFSINAMLFEFLFHVKNSLGEAIIRTVYLYKVIDNQLSLYAYGDTKDFLENGWNGGCDIEDSSGTANWPTLAIWQPLMGFEAGEYVVIIDDRYIRLYIGLNVDLHFYYTPGSNITVGGNRPHIPRHYGINNNYNLSFRNDFGEGLGGGQLYFDDVLYNSPFTPTLAACTWPHNVLAITPQEINYITRKFIKWEKGDVLQTTSLEIENIPQESAQYDANFDTYYDITVQNQLPGYSNQGQIIVGGVTQNSPYYFEVLRPYSFNTSPFTQTIDCITFTFVNWLKNGQGTSETPPFTPIDNTTYTAVYNALPVDWNRNITCNSPIDEPIVITWNEHPSSGVTYYQIYRKIKNVGNEVYLGNVNRGVMSFTDPDYLRSNQSGDPLLQYDVRPYYSPSNTFAYPSFSTVTYGTLYKKNELSNNLNKSFTEISISNYPNPFNPITNLIYTLLKYSMVNIKIYSSIGEFIIELVNESKDKGIHNIQFDGSKLPSGVYYAILRTNDSEKVTKMILTK
ncbi:MAG: T9SS type A sorting domain-containing protein [Actinobacteria bacterium]|nr:T9SS type A sorting domain-containing protein [Actinomycetota bacterium]